MDKDKIIEITRKLIKLQNDYAFEPRVMVTKERYENVYKTGYLRTLDFDNIAIREPLIEHVGHLPIIASFLWPQIEHKSDVDLGRVLIMLSIHDIGETKVGDVLTYDKKDSHIEEEYEAVKKLLPDELLKYFDEFEELETKDAKFAKAVDAIAPLLHEMTTPEITVKRFRYHDFDTEKIEKKKRKYFEWDNVLIDVFDYIIETYRGMELEYEKNSD